MFPLYMSLYICYVQCSTQTKPVRNSVFSSRKYQASPNSIVFYMKPNSKVFWPRRRARVITNVRQATNPTTITNIIMHTAMVMFSLVSRVLYVWSFVLKSRLSCTT